MTATWITPAPPAAPRTRRMVSGSPVLFVSCRSTSADTDGPALLAAMRRNRFSEALLLARREALASTAKHLRNQMRCRDAAECERELFAVTTDILAMGGGDDIH